MNQTAQITTPQNARRIGVLLAGPGKLNVAVLKYLILHINTLQQTFEYEFLPTDDSDEFLQKLSTQTTVDRVEIAAGVHPFLQRHKQFLKEEIMGYDIRDTAIPDNLIIITMTRFEDRYYSTRIDNLSILALGYWERWMAPPSIIESILTLVVQELIGIVCPPLSGSAHLGTKGCICDFTANLADARIKVLSGFICHYCRSKLDAAGFNQLPDELAHVLKKDWLGEFTNPNSPAGIASKLGYDLFITKGLTTTLWERIPMKIA